MLPVERAQRIEGMRKIALVQVGMLGSRQRLLQGIAHAVGGARAGLRDQEMSPDEQSDAGMASPKDHAARERYAVTRRFVWTRFQY